MAEKQTAIPVADMVDQYLYEHPGSPSNVSETVRAYRAGIYDYISSTHMGEHLNSYLIESVRLALDQYECELTDAQKMLFIEYLHEQVPDFEADIGAFIDAYSRDFDSSVIAYVEDLTSNTTTDTNELDLNHG